LWEPRRVTVPGVTGAGAGPGGRQAPAAAKRSTEARRRERCTGAGYLMWEAGRRAEDFPRARPARNAAAAWLASVDTGGARGV
jgi:hypothetical protein